MMKCPCCGWEIKREPPAWGGIKGRIWSKLDAANGRPVRSGDLYAAMYEGARPPPTARIVLAKAVHEMRQDMDGTAAWIETIYGGGYRLVRR